MREDASATRNSPDKWIDERGHPSYLYAIMIVECPGCTSRYDVSGRPPGTRARCRCGTVFELPELPTQAAMLECPRCAGNVSATNHSCEFCGVELLVMACPRCFSRIFHEAKHCTHCGTQVVAPASADLDGEAERRACPRCPETFLVARLVGDVLLDDCPKCLGTFVDTNALERILDARKQTTVQAVLSELAPSVPEGAYHVAAGEAEIVYVKCPDCHKFMNRRNFARGSGVIVDVCRAHGTWFDRDELAHVIAFAGRGGLARAEARLANEEKQARASQRMAAVSAEWQLEKKQTSRVTLLGDLLASLGSYLTR